MMDIIDAAETFDSRREVREEIIADRKLRLKERIGELAIIPGHPSVKLSDLQAKDNAAYGLVVEKMASMFEHQTRQALSHQVGYDVNKPSDEEVQTMLEIGKILKNSEALSKTLEPAVQGKTEGHTIAMSHIYKATHRYALAIASAVLGYEKGRIVREPDVIPSGVAMIGK